MVHQMESNRSHQLQAGIALLEVVISVALLGVALSGLSVLQQSVDGIRYQTEKKLLAIAHMDDYFNQLHTRGAVSELSSASVTDFDTGITSKTITFDDGITLTSDVVALMLDGNVKKIRAQASWVAKNGETDSVSAMTMISRFSEFDCSQPLNPLCN